MNDKPTQEDLQLRLYEIGELIGRVRWTDDPAALDALFEATADITPFAACYDEEN